MIAVVDAGLGNIGSLLNMLNHIGVPAQTVTTAAEVAAAERIILPGVGAFDAGMDRLRRSGLVEALERRVLQDRIPVLGVCLGMQMLGRASEEGATPGLGWLPATTKRFDFGANPQHLRVPHMGWNRCTPGFPGSFLDFSGEPELPRFYFVHSLHVVCDRAEHVAATATHGFAFTAAVQHGNILGVQFHPEKSHRWGKKLLERFARFS